MKRIGLIILMSIITISTAMAASIDSNILSINDVREHYDSKNERMNLKALQINESLMKAAENHSNYLELYEQNTMDKIYIQDKDKPEFAGVYPWDRVAYYNYNITKNPYTNELIYYSKDDIKVIFNKMIDDPYYRVELFNPHYQDIGYAKNGDKLVIELGGRRSTFTREMVYPFEYQQLVPYQWENSEGDITGYPITFTAYTGTDIENIVPLHIRIIESSGKGGQLPYTVITPENDKNISNSLVIIPLAPLKPNTEYQVELTANIIYSIKASAEKTVNWTFKTGGRTSTVNYINKRDKIRREEFAELIIQTAKIPLLVSDHVYDDVPKTSLYYKEIMTLRELGIMNGYSDNIFGYEDYLTREQASVMIMRLYNYLSNGDYTNERVSASKFIDREQVSLWARKTIDTANYLGIIKGYQDGYFRPKTLLNFREAEDIINRVIENAK